MQKPKYGSRKWLKAVAEMLGEQLLGIELRDDSESGNVMPPVQVTFVIPMSYDKSPNFGVIGCSATWYGEGKRGGLSSLTLMTPAPSPKGGTSSGWPESLGSPTLPKGC